MNTIQEQWDTFNADVLPPGTTDAQRRIMRRAFYAGAMSTLHVLSAVASHDTSKAAKIAMMQGFRAEMALYAEMIERGEA